MIDKRVASAAEAVSDIFDGATIMFGGFGEAGSPIELTHALIDQGATNLTMISNNCGSGQVGLAALYVLLSVVLSIGGLFAGLALVRNLA